METIWKIWAFVMVLVMLGSCTVITSADGLSKSDWESLLATIQAAEDLCYKEFILPEYPEGLRVDWGAEVYGVHNRYLSYNCGHEVYTESTSLLAQYAVLRGDQVVFEQMYDLWRNGTVNRYHLSPKYRLYQWVLKPDGDKKTSTEGIYSNCTNAAGEEARMLEVLKQASDKFTPSGERDYRDFARDIADGLKGVEDGVGNFEPCGDLPSSGYILREGFSWGIAENGSEVPLSDENDYINTPLAINNLVSYHYAANTPDWVNNPFYQSVVDNTTVVMAKAQNIDSSTGGYGLFKTMYNLSTGAYLDEYGLNESSTMRCTDMAYRLANYGHLVNNSTAISTGKRYFNFLKSKYESDGVIWGSYNYSTGAPFASWEATISTYAVFARLAMEYEDYDLAEAVLRERILPMQVMDPDNRYYGSFKPGEGKDASAFDNMEAVITLNIWNKMDKRHCKSSYPVNWTTVALIESGDGDIDNIKFDTVEAQYVRIYCTERVLPDCGYSLWEFEVYGPGTGNLALHKTGSVSSVQNNSFVQSNAFDGNNTTRWGTEFKKDPQWIYVDLGENKEINKVILSWEWAYATKYEVQVATPSIFTQYLRDLAHDTWNCIDYCVDDKTGLPYDNSEDRTYTGIDKIGLYIASVAVAKELGFISKEEAINKVNKTINTLVSEDFKTWNGSCTPYESSDIRIPYTWYNMTTLEPRPLTDDIDVCTIDLSNYYACLIIGRSAFPELNQSFSTLLDDVNWSLLYDYNENLFYGGYNTKTCNYSTWHCEYLASDSQTASYIGIATKAVPAKHWEILNRCFEEWHGYRYYVGRVCGLYSQLLPGIFIDQRQTLMGISAKNFTSGDIAHVKNTNSPVWGWSASSSVPVDISDTIAIIFYYKGTGSSNTLQFKLEDEDGSVFGKRLYNATNMSEWTKARINYSELDYYWGGDNSLDLKNITGIVFAIESGERDGIPVGEGGNGTLSISNITLESAYKTIGINVYGSWYQEVDNGTSLSLSVDHGNKIITMTYDLGEGNKWVLIFKKFGNLYYLGCGHLQDQIVTPHASILALSYFHKEVIENLNKLEEMGARDPILIDGRNYSFGFRDAINWKSGKVSGKYLTLDQAMIFLSIANYLNSTVWRLFMGDSVSKKGVSLIEDYRGHIFYFAEGEDWAEQYCGGLDNKTHASNCSCLGNGWGNNGEYAEYLINLSEDADKVLFKMRYSDNFDAKNNASRIRVYLDGELKGGLFTENTYDWDEFQWSDPVYIGYVPAGEHELKLISGNGGEWNCINLDCFKLYNVDIVISNAISNVTITKITATNATITWQTNVPADSYIHWRGFCNIFNSWADPNEYIQGITYVPPNSKSKIDEDLEDIKNHNFNTINTYELEKLDPEVGKYFFNKCKEMGLKIAFRLEWYNESSFNYSCEDADNILRHHNTSIGYAKKYPESVLCYVINMPLDDPDLTIPTKEEQSNYVSYFYNKLKGIDPVHPIYVNFYYGYADELPQASVTDIADGIFFTVYAMRHSDAPYGDDQTPNFTDQNYKIFGKDQYDYYIDKVYEENNLFILNKPLFIDTGFANWFKNPDQRNGVVADKKTKTKAVNLLKEYFKNNSHPNVLLFAVHEEQLGSLSYFIGAPPYRIGGCPAFCGEGKLLSIYRYVL